MRVTGMPATPDRRPGARAKCGGQGARSKEGVRVRPEVASRVLPAAGVQLRLTDLPNPGDGNFRDRFAQSGLFGSARIFEITKLAVDQERL